MGNAHGMVNNDAILFILMGRVKKLISELQGLTPEGDFPCDTVSYAVPDRTFHFTERVKLELGR